MTCSVTKNIEETIASLRMGASHAVSVAPAATVRPTPLAASPISTRFAIDGAIPMIVPRAYWPKGTVVRLRR